VDVHREEGGVKARAALSALVLLAALLGILTASAVTLLLGWNPCPDVDGYRVFAGPTSRGWDTNWVCSNTTATFEVPDYGRWFFVVRAERNYGNTTNFAVSAMSDEVVFEYLPPPVVWSETWVALRPVIECSTNLFSWSSVTGAPTWIQATNDQEFFRTRELVIERVNKVEGTP